ncbi:MAG: hypothetical protein AB8B80_03550 [Marinicellaceae bacterium]
MLAPASHSFDNLVYDKERQNNSMHLGQWRNHISQKLNPIYFSQLSDLSYDNRYINNPFNFSVEEFTFETPVFSHSDFSASFDHSELYFSFSTKSLNATPLTLGRFISSLSPNRNFGKSQTNYQIVKQDYYAPSYTFSKGSSSFGLGFILVQQRFLDDSFGSVTYAVSTPLSISEDPSFLSTNRGVGYNLDFVQNLPANIDLSFNYQTKIEMNEFDLLGQSYSDPGDFDIPSHFSANLSIPFLKSHEINFKAEKIQYSEIDTNVHSGYSEAFLTAFNSPISPIFKLDDLTVYSMHYEKLLNDTTTVNLGVLSRQQAPALANIYNRILENDTAKYSYQLGFLHKLPFGEINFVASFANKPIMIGSTDFGRFSTSTLDKHLEGVLSWNLNF